MDESIHEKINKCMVSIGKSGVYIPTNLPKVTKRRCLLQWYLLDVYTIKTVI